MRNMILAIVAYAILTGFLAILFFTVPRADLGAVIALTLGLAGYDFIRNFREKNNN
ncbi:hypothetical protein [Oricola cellulosilytica]|nr:hypothetical protein [Oricola cellulosilytica]